ncbi:hypothetical protein [Pseudonocardia sp. GCM10023141]|uniref:hypothetical protein n=1 Tax=Pseudonocardia sp. GCM10023141 TaxID=3252653 RepID=UPI003617A77E
MTAIGTSAPHRFVFAAGICGAAGGLVFLVLGLTAPLFPTVTSGFDPWMALATGGLVLIVIGLLGLARSALAGAGVLARCGSVAAVVGMAGFAVAHALAALDATQSDSPLFRIEVLGSLGLLLTGVAVLRAGRWPGWGRFTPLACGLYPFVILIPAFAIFGEPNFPAIAGFGVPLILLGVALAGAPGTPRL